MSYGVHIKRSEAQDAHGITLEEWLTYVRSDQEVCLVGEANYKSSQGNTVQWEAPGMTEWIHPQTGRKTWFDDRTAIGVSVGNLSREKLVKMFKVANALGGVVQSDEGEYCDVSGNPIRSK